MISCNRFPKNVFSQALGIVLVLWLGRSEGFGNSADPWIHNAFGYRVEITNLNPAYGVSLQDFPVLITFSNAGWLKSANNVSSTGGDISFAGVDGQQLFHQIESFNKTTGSVSAWVCIPTFTNSTRIYLYYGFDSSKSPAGVPFSGSNSYTNISATYSSLLNTEIQWLTWDPNFLLVWHFNETSGYARDSTVNQLHAYTNNTNVWINSNGVGGTRGYFSIPGWGLGGVRSTAFRTTGTALYETARSNTLTHSLWFKWLGSISNNPWYTNNMTQWVPPNQTNATATLFAIRGNSSMGSSDGKGVLTVNQGTVPTFSFANVSANGLPATYVSQVVTNTNSQFNAHSNWFYYGFAATNNGTSRLLDVVVNDFPARTTSGTAFDTTTGINELAVAGTESADSGAPPSITHRYSPWGYFDEYRLSRGSRSTNWLVSEFSNIILSTNMLQDNVVTPPEPLLTGRITNYTSFPSPVAGGTLILGLDVPALVVPNRPPSFVSNVFWYVTNLDTGWSSLTNADYNGEASAYTNVIAGLPAGNYLARAVLTADDLSGAPITYNFVVGSEAFYDLRNFRVYSTNSGFVIDLFQGLDGGNAKPLATNIYRDGSLTTSLLSNAGGGKFFDTNDLFYDEYHAYQAVIQYSNTLYYTNGVVIAAGKKNVFANITSAGGVVENLEMKITLPIGALDATKALYLNWPNDVVGIDGYRQLVLDDGDGIFSIFNQPVTIRLKVRVAGGSITVPGTTKRLVLNDANKLRLGYWDGFQWNPLPTTLVSFSNRVELTTSVTREGRFALLFNDGSSAAIEPFRIRNRVLVPGSADPVYNTIYLGWDKAVSDKVTLSVYTQNGKLVYQKKDMLDPFWIWDGKGSDGVALLAGVYLYTAQVGTKVYRGSLAIMGQ